jgi:hypothetical protein
MYIFQSMLDSLNNKVMIANIFQTTLICVWEVWIWENVSSFLNKKSYVCFNIYTSKEYYVISL